MKKKLVLAATLALGFSVSAAQAAQMDLFTLSLAGVSYSWESTATPEALNVQPNISFDVKVSSIAGGLVIPGGFVSFYNNENSGGFSTNGGDSFISNQVFIGPADSISKCNA